MNFCGMTFETTPEAHGAFRCFDPDCEEATDTGPYGMVQEMRAFIRITEGMKQLIDVGALYGLFSLVFTRNRDAVAHALEPSPWLYPGLVQVAAMNPDRQIVPRQMFAGETEGRLVECGRDWNHIMAARDFGAGQFDATTQTIDSLNLKPDCMKIDVEAYECAVLRGARETIARSRPVIFLECHFGDLWRHNESAETLGKILDDYGYRREGLDGGEDVSFGRCAMTRVVCRPE